MHNLNWPFERVVTDKLAPQASLHQLAAMLQSAVDAIISIDAAGIVESVNPATEKRCRAGRKEREDADARALSEPA